MVKGKKSADRGPKGPLTWIVSGCGLIIISATLLIVTLDAVSQSTPARLDVVERSRATRDGATSVQIEILNRGGDAAAAVEVEGRSSSGAATVTIDYVAGRSSRKATLVFAGDPGPVTLKATGWSEP